MSAERTRECRFDKNDVNGVQIWCESVLNELRISCIFASDML